jgi:tol-pal system protein YbgF
VKRHRSFLSFLSFSIFFLLLSGCASQDSQFVRRDIDTLQRQIDSLREEIKGTEPSSPQSAESMGARKQQADMEAELEIMKRDLNSLKAAMEDNQELTTRAFRRLDDLKKTSTTRLNDFEARLDQELAKVEGARRPSPAVSPPGDAKTPSPVEVKAPPPSEAPPGQVSSDVERIYREGYEALKVGDLDGARDKFLSFLKEHPDTPLSDNAQFWIGEIYFKKHQYEAAILAYEDVIKKYPNSNKLPDTLLKQGLAFLELGDKIDARIILENLIKKYPTSEQARIAKGTLKTLK